MMPSFLPGRLLWLGLLLLSFASQAEPITPFLDAAEFVRLRAQLWRTPASPRRVNLLLVLSTDLLAHHDDTSLPLDSAATYAQQAYALSNKLNYPDGRINSLYHLGWFHVSSGLDTLGPGLIRQGIALSQRLGRRRLKAFGWYYLADGYSRSPADLPAKIATYQRARSLFHQLTDQQDEAYLLKRIADMHQVQGHPEQAIPELLEVLAIYRRAGHRELYYTYDLLASCYRHLNDLKEALSYSLVALEGVQATADTSSIARFYERLAAIAFELKQYSEARQYFQKALNNSRRNHEVLQAVNSAGAIGFILLAQGKGPEAIRFFTQATQAYVSGPPQVTRCIAYYLGGLHARLGHYALSERYYAQMLAYLATGKAEDWEKLSSYHSIGKLYVLTGRYREASAYLQQALALSQHLGGVLNTAELHRLLFKADSAQGRFPAAIAHYQQYKLLTDSIFNEKKHKQLAMLQIQYATKKKEQNIALLTKQNQVQMARLQQQQAQRNAVIVAALLLALVLVLGYNRYRLKQRTTQLLQAQQQEIHHKNEVLELLVNDKQHLLDEKENLLEEKEELLHEKDWMLKEIHHRVKNNLQVVSSLLNTQADYLRDPAALAALRESQNRVQAMALVHQKLYQSDSLALVNMQEYIQEITEHLLESFDCLGTVREQLDVAPVELDVALATPLGLIINEAITNALKHAFPPGRAGALTISLQPVGAHRYELRVADDGVGLPAGFDAARSQSLGLTMITGLSKQINGALAIASAGPGVQITLQFEVARKPVRMEMALT